MMKTYARLQDGRAVELLTIAGEIGTMFHPSLVWIDVTSVVGIAVGWEYDGGHWNAPKVAPDTSAGPSIADLQAQLVRLSAQLAALRQAD